MLANEYKNCTDKRFSKFTEQKKRFIFIELLHEYSVLTQLSHKVKCARGKTFVRFLVCECVWWRMIGKKCLATNSLLAKTCMRAEFNMANYGCKAGGNSDTFNACPYFLFVLPSTSISNSLSFASHFSGLFSVAFEGD